MKMTTSSFNMYLGHNLTACTLPYKPLCRKPGKNAAFLDQVHGADFSIEAVFDSEQAKIGRVVAGRPFFDMEEAKTEAVSSLSLVFCLRSSELPAVSIMKHLNKKGGHTI